MKLYYPMAKCKDGYEVNTYNWFIKLDDCRDVFEAWEDYYGVLKEMWIDVSDSEDDSYKGRIEVKRDYILVEEEERKSRGLNL